MSYRSAKGVFDILPKDPDSQDKWKESYFWQFLENKIREIAHEYDFHEIRTPLFETTELFTRSIGTHTDIVIKEMYTFHDKAGRSLTLRPEGTAPVMRAFIEKNLSQLAPVHKFFYIAPMFRYERQQAGRYRQHHQFGVEAIGNASPFQDAEVIHLLWTFYERLGLKELILQLNSIGDLECRAEYKKALKEYFKPFVQQLSAESQDRYHHNPFRILDSKDPQDRKILEDAPKIFEYLNPEAKEHFNKLCNLLTELAIPYQINPFLVRGLDYYNYTVFEIVSHELGAQNSLGGGGRYDGLLKELGGPDLPAFGFGAGIERIIHTMLAQKVPLPSPPSPLLFLIPLGEKAREVAFQITCALRQKHFPVEIELSERKLKNSMRLADTLGARFVGVIGEDELGAGKIELKEMVTGKTEKIELTALETRLAYEVSKNA